MYFENERLLTPPVKRAAYSDRSALLMAEMSRLAYFKFEGSVELTSLAKSLADATDEKDIKETLEKLLAEQRQSADQAVAELRDYLARAEFELIKTFNHNGTQAFLATSAKHNMGVLAFRGTEKDIRDIKTDLKAPMIETDGNKIHSGFYTAFNDLKPQIESALNAIEDSGCALYITGHSLGGALALLATKFLASDSLGACYTFGSPRVASSKFGDNIKTPIYRVINAADLVPRVPPAYLSHALIAFFEFFAIPVVSTFIIRLLQRVVGYRHHGDMRYLTASKEDFSDLRLIQNPTIIDRVFRLIKRVSVNWRAGATDHFILNYCKKLEAYAGKRNSSTVTESP